MCVCLLKITVPSIDQAMAYTLISFSAGMVLRLNQCSNTSQHNGPCHLSFSSYLCICISGWVAVCLSVMRFYIRFHLCTFTFRISTWPQITRQPETSLAFWFWFCVIESRNHEERKIFYREQCKPYACYLDVGQNRFH